MLFSAHLLYTSHSHTTCLLESEALSYNSKFERAVFHELKLMFQFMSLRLLVEVSKAI